MLCSVREKFTRTEGDLKACKEKAKEIENHEKKRASLLSEIKVLCRIVIYGFTLTLNWQAMKESMSPLGEEVRKLHLEKADQLRSQQVR